MKKINIYYINKIKECRVRIFNAEDDDIVDRRAVANNERVIENYLDKANIFDEDLRKELLDNIKWYEDNNCEKLEKLGWKIIRKER